VRARVRELQRHGEPADRVRAGERAAVALAGVDRVALRRGHNLVANAPWQAAELLTVLLQALADGPPIRTRQRVRLHLGTASVPARLAIPTGLVEPGTHALAQLLLEGPIIARAGDRAVLRAWSPLRTIGGVLILEPFPQRRKRLHATDRARLTALAQPDAALPALLELAGPDGVSAAALPLLLPDAGGTPPASGDDVAIGSRVVHRRFVDTAAATVLQALDSFHTTEPIAPGADRERLRREAGLPQFLFEHVVQQLMQRGRIEGRGPALARPDHLPAPAPRQEAALQRLSTIFDEAGIDAPDLHDLPTDLAADPALPAMLRHLETAGTLQRIAPGRWAATAAVSRAITALYEQLPAGQQLAIADFRDVLRISRRHLLPFLEYLDTIGVTTRTGDHRRLDPVAPAAWPAVSSTAASPAAPEP
jgi:selenocysteine-specific elongation factor